MSNSSMDKDGIFCTEYFLLDSLKFRLVRNPKMGVLVHVAQILELPSCPTPPLHQTPQTQSALAWDELIDHFRVLRTPSVRAGFLLCALN